MEVAGWFVGPIVTRVINAGFDYLKDQVGWKTHVKEELDRLQLILPSIQAVVDFAFSQTEISNQNLKKWLWQLRDVIDEADDVLDDFEYMKHEQQLTKNKKKKNVRSTISYMTKGFVKFGKRALKNDPNLKRLEEVVNKLDKVSAGVGVFLHLFQNTKQEQQQQQLELYESRKTGPLPKSNIIGRGNDKEYVMQWLMSNPSNEEDQTAFYKNISLLSIVGHGGMGKTTLLQHVYEDIKKTKEFDLEMWVCVSTNFDAKKVIADMLEYVTEGRPDVEAIGKLQENLKSKVNSKKFLLVLDDIWEEVNEERNKSKWEDVIAPLVSGCLGSKILLTTRLESVASMMAKVLGKKKSETLKVEGLEEKECLELLNAHAFAGVENPDHHKKLRFIAGQMVKKLSGSPLAAKMMGGVLNSSLEERHWDKVLRSVIGNIMPILRLSYTFLSKHLQICFAFCGIFPHDHKFDKDDLVRMWIALGFIQPPDNRGETMEDIGGRYFDALVKKSFFDEFDDYYKMHDLLHDLAESISKHECLRVEGDQELFSETLETIRHLFLEKINQELLKNIEKFKNLRSLFLHKNVVVNVDIITKILNAARSIRLLYINCGNFKIIAQAVDYLTHLRYLNIDYSMDLKLPTSLCNLYHMQFIICNHLFHISSKYIFPEDMNHLSNLRYLKFPSSEFPIIHEIGKLTSLQKLDKFKVQNKSGYRIGELEQMNNLRELHIYSLNKVKDAQEAYNAKLRDKKNLTNLSLNWDAFRDPIDIDLNDEKVFDNLQPPSCLKKLMMENYMGVRSAKWMNTADFISNLEIIKPNSCSNWRTLPHFGRLRFLKSLHLDSMPEVKQFDNKFHGNDERCFFPSLEMPGDMFPCLTQLHLSNCPNLQELPYLPPKLNKLFIYNIGWETLNCCSISKLKELKVSFCPNITTISLTRLAASRLLEIKNCPKLISLGGHTEVETIENCQLILSRLGISDPSILLMEPLRSITSIEKLVIENNDELVSFPFEAEGWFLKVSSSLLKLKFASLQSLQSLPSSLERLSSLKKLSVIKVSQLQELPNLPPSLAKLRLENLDKLDCLPSCLPSLSSLNDLTIMNLPQLRELPNFPPSLANLRLVNLDNVDCLPSCLPSFSSLKRLSIINVPQLRELPNLPPSLGAMHLRNLDNLDCLPTCLPSLSSLCYLSIILFPRLQDLPDLPCSLADLRLENLDNLNCLPSCLSSLSSLKHLFITKVPQLRELPNLPPSLAKLLLENLDNLDCLPSCLPSLSSLNELKIMNIPQLRELPNLPPSLRFLTIRRVPQLRDLPDLPSSLIKLSIGACHPKLMKRCQRDKGSDWHKIVVRVID